MQPDIRFLTLCNEIFYALQITFELFIYMMHLSYITDLALYRHRIRYVKIETNTSYII